MKYYIVDAFATNAFDGNPAGVVFLSGDDFPDENRMAKIAMELRFSETAFVLCHSEKEYTIRYFTPKAEVDVCGHATIAAFSFLHQRRNVSGLCVCHTHAGDLNVDCGDIVMMQMAAPKTIKEIEDASIIDRAIGFDTVKTPLPMQIVSMGLPDIMLQVPNIHTLNHLKPDMGAISEITSKYKAVSIHVFTIGGDNYTAHVRNFAPLYGIPEEAATGTANAALTYYLQKQGVISKPGEFSFIQGEAMGRPSVIKTKMGIDDTIYVGGTAVVVAKGELFV